MPGPTHPMTAKTETKMRLGSIPIRLAMIPETGANASAQVCAIPVTIPARAVADDDDAPCAVSKSLTCGPKQRWDRRARTAEAPGTSQPRPQALPFRPAGTAFGHRLPHPRPTLSRTSFLSGSGGAASGRCTRSVAMGLNGGGFRWVATGVGRGGSRVQCPEGYRASALITTNVGRPACCQKEGS